MKKEQARKLIVGFCKGCDFQNRRDKSCREVGDNQILFVKRGSCYFASMDGVKGTMTTERFIPSM